MGLVFRSAKGAAVLEATWALLVVPSGMPDSRPDISPRNMPLGATSDEAEGSMGTEFLAVELRGPLGCCSLATPSYHCSIFQPTLGLAELPAALGSYFSRGALGLGPVIEQMPGSRAAAGWLRRAV